MTEASREMFSDELVEAMESLHMYPRMIAERAAREAVTAALTALRAEVSLIPGFDTIHEAGEMVRRRYVLAAIDKAMPR